MKYVVVCARDDFTCFVGRKSFWFYKNAIKFAESKKQYFDFIWVERFDKKIKEIKKGKGYKNV